MKLATIFLFGVLTLFAPPAISINGGRHEIEQLADITRNLPRSVRAEMIAQKYHFLYPAADFSNYDIEALRARFESADIATFYSHDSAIADEMLEIYGILRDRGANHSKDLSAVAGAQIISRNFGAIEEISGTEPLPEEFDIPIIENRVSDENANWQILRPSENKLVRDIRSIKDGKFVVVISNPLCGFSDAATKVIESDKHLSSFFTEYGLWLVPPARRLYSNEVISWNKNHQSQEMVLAYQARNWPIIDDWSTPIFYFVNDGNVVDKVVGWPKNGQNLMKLKAAIDRFIGSP